MIIMHNAPENAKYTSPSIQNEMICLCEKKHLGGDIELHTPILEHLSQ